MEPVIKWGWRLYTILENGTSSLLLSATVQKIVADRI